MPALYILLGLGAYALWHKHEKDKKVQRLAPPPVAPRLPSLSPTTQPPPPGAPRVTTPAGPMRRHWYLATIQKRGQPTQRKRFSIPATNRTHAKQKLLASLANQYPGATVGLRFLRVG